MERTSIMLGAYIDPSIHIYTISYTFLSLSCFYSMRDPGLKFNSVAHQLCMYILRSFQYGGQGGLLGLDGPMGEKEEGKKGREVEGLKKSIHMYICCCYFLLYIHGEIKFEKARKKKKKKKEREGKCPFNIIRVDPVEMKRRCIQQDFRYTYKNSII